MPPSMATGRRKARAGRSSLMGIAGFARPGYPIARVRSDHDMELPITRHNALLWCVLTLSTGAPACAQQAPPVTGGRLPAMVFVGGIERELHEQLPEAGLTG